MADEDARPTPRRRSAWIWPWAVLALAAVPAVWHVVDFEHEPDREYPQVVRPTFSRFPPAAYRLAEPGDTIDRVGYYAAAGAVVLAALGWLGGRASGRGAGLWPAATGLALAAAWYAANPGPCADGWHGLGWRAIADPAAPPALRLALAAAALGLAAFVAGTALAVRGRWGEWLRTGRAAGAVGLLIVAAGLVAFRQVEVPGIGPVGYWPRWAFAWGMMALDGALVLVLPTPNRRRMLRWGLGLSAWAGLVAGGLGLAWYQRPIARLKEGVPGKIYICAMPTYRGLEVAQARHHFKTIVNLFPENTDRRSPRLPEEMRFAREHGIRYVLSPNDPEALDEFIDETLRIAQDPDAWPVLVHCHGCMDRTPAWLGIYRFVVEGRPLGEIMREIERHRGYRPKASVTVMYTQILPARAPERFRDDPTAQLLIQCANGACDPSFAAALRRRAERANPEGPVRVSRRERRDRAEGRPRP